MKISRLFLACLISSLPFPALAHPHIFVDTGLRILGDELGRAIGVEVTWAYDDLYSLLVLEDMELDGDYDGILTPAELAKLDKFDMNWVEGYEGDLYVRGAEGKIPLGGSKPVDTRFEAGKIITRHIRYFPKPQKAIELRAYDPTFYTAYDLSGGIVAPEGCTVIRHEADLDAAYARVEALMKETDYAEDDYPEVGDAFADTVAVTCAGD